MDAAVQVTSDERRGEQGVLVSGTRSARTCDGVDMEEGVVKDPGAAVGGEVTTIEPSVYAREHDDAIEAANRRLRDEIAGLPDVESPDFWPWMSARTRQCSPEALVHLTREFKARGRVADIEQATDELVARAYPIAMGIVRRTLLSRPQDHEDAVCDAFTTMWEHIAAGTVFWERNFVGALHAACISACRKYLAKKRSDTSFSKLDAGVAQGDAEALTSFEGRLRDEHGERDHDGVVAAMSYQSMLDLLDPSLREVARLVAEGELTQRQIAAQLGCTEKTVYNRMGKVRARLAAYYEETWI